MKGKPFLPEYAFAVLTLSLGVVKYWETFVKGTKKKKNLKIFCKFKQYD